MYLAIVSSCVQPGAGTHDASPAPGAAATPIKHVIVIMQENRSFDHYFGTFPGADGFPVGPDGKFTTCVPDPATKTCVLPFHDTADRNFGGPHNVADSSSSIDGGKMDGFIIAAEAAKAGCASTHDPACGGSGGTTDVMGFHDDREIPNYWSYAKNYVLQDHMFESVSGWSLPSHLSMVSGWSAKCSVVGDPSSCRNAPQYVALPPDFIAAYKGGGSPDYAWTDLTYLLHKNNVSWRYYIETGGEPDCRDDAATCPTINQNVRTPGIWNPLPSFDTVKQDGELGNIQDVGSFYTDARNGTLPAVSWIAPSQIHSEHPSALVSDGQAWVTNMVNSVMAGPDWSSSAIFVSWDDWGGFYDHVVPPTIDVNGYGLRVPGLVISPYAKKGLVDHQVLSHDAYLKFIEDNFLKGQRIDPSSDGRPDPRPDVRETSPQLGNLMSDFDFKARSRPAMLLPPDNWSAGYAVPATPVSWTAGHTQAYSVTLSNTGVFAWNAAGPNPVDLAVNFANAGGGHGHNTFYTDQRILLPRDVAPGTSATMTITVTPPTSNTGPMILEYQMVKEHQFWFTQFEDIPISVLPPGG